MEFFRNLFGKKKPEPVNTDGTDVSLVDVIALAWKHLDAEMLVPYLDDNFQYNSVWISNTMNGKDNYLHYLRGKFETIKKSGVYPFVDLIEENGKLLPHLRQKDLCVESVLDYKSANGKITKMLMRPILRLKVVEDEEWDTYAQAYQDFLPTALQIAGNAIQSYVNEKGLKFPEFSWIQTRWVSPSFQHLCFRCGTQIYSILIAIHGFSTKEGNDDDSIVVSKKDYDNLVNECQKHNLIPCIMPIFARPQLPIFDSCHLINGVTDELILLKTNCNTENIAMSKWEINSMGINIVIQHLEQQKYHNITFCDVVGIEPQIWFEKDGKKSYVIIRAIPIGYRNHKFKINKNMLVRLSDYDGYFADIQFASSAPILKDEHGNIVPLSKRDGDEDIWMWRGDSFYCNFTGLQEIERAIVNNEFIDVIDIPNYDI